MILMAGSFLAADKDDLSAAIAKLAAADNYSWKSTPTNIPPPGAAADAGGGQRRGRGGGFGAGAVDGKAQKDGLIYVSMPGRGGAVTEGFVKGAKGAIKAGEEGWSSLAEATADDGGGGFNMARFAAMRVQNIKSPADAAKDLLAKTKSISLKDGAYIGDLTEEAVKTLMSVGGRGGGDGPEISGAKGSVKFWVKDGMLIKYETTAQGTMSFGGNDMERNTVTTVEIKDVGATKLDVPDDAKKKMS